MSRELRVLVEPIDPRHAKPGGVDTCIRGLVKFSGSGMEIRIVGVDAIGDAQLGQWRLEHIDGREVWFLPVYRADNTVIRPRVPHVVQLVAGLWRYRARIRELGTVTLQTHRVTTGLALRNLLHAERHIQFVHNDGEDTVALGKESYFTRAPRVFRYLERRSVVRSADTVVFNRRAAERLAAWGGNVRFSPTWFDDEYFSIGERKVDTRRELLWVGRFEDTKDPILAIEAIAQLDSGYRLTMLGNGSLLEDSRARVARLGLDSRITLVGAVEKRKVSEYLKQSDLLVMTSLHEGYPRAVVEALASGLPVVTTDGGEPNGLVVEGYNGTRVSERTPVSVAEAIQRAAHLSGEAAVKSVERLRASKVVPYVLSPNARETDW